MDTISTINPHKLELTRGYCQRHYGFDDYRLKDPKLIVIHHTVIPTLKETLDLFKQDHLASNRSKIGKYSKLNVGIHYVVDKDGGVYSLMPDTIIARHVIGFNHVSIGIENVAATKEDLTEEQLQSNTELVRYIADKYKSIEFLIGHDEYLNTTLPHYSLYKSLDKNYLPYPKPDPGSIFMANLRDKLKEEGLAFKD